MDNSHNIGTADERVARGLGWLREHGAEHGLDAARVDPSTLALTDGSRCVLAQASGGQSYGIVISKILDRPSIYAQIEEWDTYHDAQDAWARSGGFLPEQGEWGAFVESDVDALTEAWKRALITERV